MYEYIKGTVAEVAPAYAVIDVGGVGYYLHISLETYSAIEHETETRLYVHYVVREDAQLLYGFSTKVERELFRLLISVSGVGGNTARMILSTYSPRELQGIITAGNAVLLKNVKGLGLKTAQKIIVELKDKAAGLGSTGTGSPAQTIAAGPVRYRFSMLPSFSSASTVSSPPSMRTRTFLPLTLPRSVSAAATEPVPVPQASVKSSTPRSYVFSRISSGPVSS